MEQGDHTQGIGERSQEPNGVFAATDSTSSFPTNRRWDLIQSVIGVISIWPPFKKCKVIVAEIPGSVSVAREVFSSKWKETPGVGRPDCQADSGRIGCHNQKRRQEQKTNRLKVKSKIRTDGRVGKKFLESGAANNGARMEVPKLVPANKVPERSDEIRESRELDPETASIVTQRIVKNQTTQQISLQRQTHASLKRYHSAGHISFSTPPHRYEESQARKSTPQLIPVAEEEKYSLSDVESEIETPGISSTTALTTTIRGFQERKNEAEETIAWSTLPLLFPKPLDQQPDDSQTVAEPVFELGQLENQLADPNSRSYQAATTAAIQELVQARSRCLGPNVHVLVTLNQSNTPRHFVLKYGPGRPLRFGDIVTSHGTLLGEWKMTNVKHREGKCCFLVVFTAFLFRYWIRN
ncbi:hypothetical protein B0H13DRAFT_1929837 [Mycena leptocephala]|nr:hypothetical protein B0H13DRAFT_1929837 [Mycena leptocephala]